MLETRMFCRHDTCEGTKMSTESGGMHIELLGPLSVRMNQVPVMPAAAKPRQVLAILTLNAGRVVTVSTLIEELWGDRPPPSAPTTLQTYIVDLRKRLATATGAGAEPPGGRGSPPRGSLL